ncbi:MAG: hypothetical protein ACSLE0_13455 [Chitinophagaceae bacterium]
MSCCDWFELSIKRLAKSVTHIILFGSIGSGPGKTLAGLKAIDDAWFAARIDESMNNHWAWFHILEHQANHMGQIALVK